MEPDQKPVIVIGAGIAGLSCALRLHKKSIPVRVIEASRNIGGRIKTDRHEGFLLDHGFQVLQTAYPEARRTLDLPSLDLRCFAPGAMVRIRGRFYTVADPLRRPRKLVETLQAPIGDVRDRLRLLRLAHRACRGQLEALFRYPETTAMDFLRAEGFSKTMIERFFVPFFGGVCLDPEIQASSRVLLYVLRMFASGEAALPALGMGEIPKQLTSRLPSHWVHTSTRVQRIDEREVYLEDGRILSARAIVVATQGPEASRLLNRPYDQPSVAETCIYFSCNQAPKRPPYLLLNGDGSGPINNIAFPSRISPAYAPANKSLASVVVLGNPDEDNDRLVRRVKDQLTDWFGTEAHRWSHLKTYRILHALPDQSPPTQDPCCPNHKVRSGLYVCGEYGSLPGIQWALLSGRLTADAIQADLLISSV